MPERTWYLGGAAPLRGRQAYLLLALVALAAAVVWTIRYRTAFDGLRSPDACDYAQMGRQLARGQGFTSLQTFPYELGWLDAHGLPTRPPWPNLHRFPLITVLEALAFKFVGEHDLGAVLPGGAFLVATAVVAFALGNRLFGAFSGLIASLAATLSPTQLANSLSGLTEPGAAFFIVATALLVIATVDRGRSASGLAFLAGTTLGLAYLHRSNLIFWHRLPPSACWWGSTGSARE